MLRFASEEAGSEVQLQVSGKLCALGVVAAAVITAFGTERPAEDGVPLAVQPRATVREAPLQAGAPQPHGPPANLSLDVRATGYNSLSAQTDATPHVTATGTRTRFGVLAVSRDLLANDVPYGSLVRLHDMGNYHDGRNPGRFQALLDSQGIFVVEDTMHQRKTNQIDVWFSDYASAVNWGVRQVRVEVVRYGYDGPELRLADAPEFEGTPRLLALR